MLVEEDDALGGCVENALNVDFSLESSQSSLAIFIWFGPAHVSLAFGIDLVESLLEAGVEQLRWHNLLEANEPIWHRCALSSTNEHQEI
jgi:hypothetical protein